MEKVSIRSNWFKEFWRKRTPLFSVLRILVLLIAPFLVTGFVLVKTGMIWGQPTIFPAQQLVIPKKASVVSWEEAKILAEQCNIQLFVDGHMADSIMLKDGHSFRLEGSPGYGGMAELSKSIKSKCGYVGVGME